MLIPNIIPPFKGYVPSPYYKSRSGYISRRYALQVLYKRPLRTFGFPPTRNPRPRTEYARAKLRRKTHFISWVAAGLEPTTCILNPSAQLHCENTAKGTTFTARPKDRSNYALQLLP